MTPLTYLSGALAPEPIWQCLVNPVVIMFVFSMAPGAAAQCN